MHPEGYFTWPQLGPFFVPACPPLTAINGHFSAINGPFFCSNSVLYGHYGLWKRLKKAPVNARISGQKKGPKNWGPGGLLKELRGAPKSPFLEEDKRATTNVQNGFVFSFESL